jgi:hypothetical protein
VSEAVIEHNELARRIHEFALPESDMQGREGKLTAEPFSLNLDFTAELFSFAFNQKINAKFIGVFEAGIATALPKLHCSIFGGSVVLLPLIFLKLFKHRGAPDFSDKRSSSLSAIHVDRMISVETCICHL